MRAVNLPQLRRYSPGILATTAEMQSNALPEGDDELRSLVSTILSGECAEELYLEDVTSICEGKPQNAAALRALIGRYHRLGRMSAAQHQRIRAAIDQALAPKQARRTPAARDDYPVEDLTCELSAEPQPGSRTRVFAHQSSAPQITVRPVPPPVAPEIETAPVKPTWTPPSPESSSGAGIKVLHERYELQQLLGRGGMASVYKAVDRYRAQLGLLDCFVAVKLVHANAAKPAGSEALAREFHSAQRLSHPNVVKVFDVDHDGDTIFYTMEMLSGERLSQVLRRIDGSVLPRPYALAIIRDIGAAVAHAHARGVVHADLKPSNVMITLDGEVRVVDFGGASMPPREPWVSEGDAEEAYLAATPAYASCEQLERRRADPRDDIYALACITYLLLSGRHPFDRLSSLDARAQGLRAQRPAGMSQRQWRVLRRGLAWSRDQQPLSVESWLAQLDLRGAVRSLPPLVSLTTQLAPPRTWYRSAAAVVAVLAVGLGAWALHAQPHADWSRTFSAAVGSARATLQDAWQGLQPHPRSVAPAVAAREPAHAVALVPAAVATTTTAPEPAVASPAPAKAVPAAALIATAAAAETPAPAHVVFAAQNYTVADGEPAARIVIQRVGDTRGELSFVWWTEPSSAQPDVDYASLGHRIEHMDSGQDKLTVYVPIISSNTHGHSTQFQVSVSDLGGGHDQSDSPSARATVTIDRGD
jgi:hypothetical protein